MNYIILPLLAVSYIIWTYYAIKELNKWKWKFWESPHYCASFAELWLFLHVSILIEIILVFLIGK